jgi:hypothetical protein
MGFFGKLFAQKEKKKDIYPDVPDGMKGVFMKGIGMH